MDPFFDALVARASNRYRSTSLAAWEFARGKLRADPVYRSVLMGGVLPNGGVLVDVGCGQGLMLALLAESAAAWRAGNWPAGAAPPLFDRLVGIEMRPRVASLARRALGDAAEILIGDARVHTPEECRAVLLFDVLQMMPAGDQIALLRRVAEAVGSGGAILVREADAAAGWRFWSVRTGNRAKALAVGNWRQTFHYRSLDGWRRVFSDAGLAIQERDTAEGTPFANVLFVLTPSRRGSG